MGSCPQVTSFLCPFSQRPTFMHQRYKPRSVPMQMQGRGEASTSPDGEFKIPRPRFQHILAAHNPYRTKTHVDLLPRLRNPPCCLPSVHCPKKERPSGQVNRPTPSFTDAKGHNFQAQVPRQYDLLMNETRISTSRHTWPSRPLRKNLRRSCRPAR